MYEKNPDRSFSDVAVLCRTDAQTAALTEPVKARLARLAGRRMTQDGVLVISAQRYRSQERNREDAIGRLVALIRRAAVPPVPRKPTKASAAERRRRREAKHRRSELKSLRRRPTED